MVPIRRIISKVLILLPLVFLSVLLLSIAGCANGTIEPTDNDEVENFHFSFCYNHIDLDVRIGDIEAYTQAKVPRFGTDYIGVYRFVTDNDPTLIKLYRIMEEIMDKEYPNGITDQQKANHLLKFVYYNVSYQSDDEQFGMPGYVQFPLETLCRGYGDCEDFALLLLTLYHLAGLDSVFAMMPGHAAVGVALDIEGNYVTKPFSDTHYLIADAVSGDFVGWSTDDFVIGIDMDICRTLSFIYIILVLIGSVLLLSMYKQ